MSTDPYGSYDIPHFLEENGPIIKSKYLNLQILSYRSDSLVTDH